MNLEESLRMDLAGALREAMDSAVLNGAADGPCRAAQHSDSRRMIRQKKLCMPGSLESRRRKESMGDSREILLQVQDAAWI